ncbi:hypothetical protein CMK11_20190, partial [Candidatus Poribacteria bacterium]|nr:hypothetical protein [Candidatus Poribacteria bacterium]
LCGLALAYWAGAKLVADGDSRQAPGVRPGSTAEAAILFRPLAPPMPPARALIREGSEADGWEAAWPQNDATVPQRELARRFSGGLGASVSNDHGVFRALPPAPGVVTMRVWIEPAMGPHTTSVGFVCEGQRTGVAKVCKDGTDRWGYAVGGQTTYVADARAGGHEVALVYRTGSATMDIRIDGAMVAGNVHYPDNVGKAVIGIIMASGRGGVGATTHFDDLSVHVRHSVRRVAPPVVMDYDAPPTLRDTVHLLAGEANGLTLAASDPVIRVRAGEVIRGSVTVDVHNSHGPAAGFVVVETPTWGVAQHSYRIVAASAPPAHSRHTVHLDRRAPAEPGTYFIIVAAAAETEGLYVASGTNWTNGEAVWGNGLEVASWRSGATSQAMRTGSVDADWLMRHGERSSRQLGAAAVKVIVGP